MITPSGGIRSSGLRLHVSSIMRRRLSSRSLTPVEQNDHRGTFYFAQLATAAPKGSNGLVGFHGAGGGGSMMSMDAIVNAGFTIANFTDTSGNPSASKKVFFLSDAARIILAQPDLVGYFGSGSGVASQEQYWSAYGLAKGVLGNSISTSPQ